MRLNTPAFVAISGLCFLILGLFSSFVFPKLQAYLIAKETALQEGTKAFKSWKKIPFPFKFKIYFFNVTNPEEVQSGSNPVFKEIGPYIYDEFREREILSISEENDTITFIQRKTYFFNEEDSGCRSENDIVTIINVAAVSTALKVYKMAPSALSMVNDALPFLYPGIKNIFTTNSVKNILFEGLKMLCESEEVDMICSSLQDEAPPTVRLAENKRDFLIAMFHHINGTEDGPYEIERGLKGTTKGKVVGFKNRNMLSEWRGDSCNKIQGTDLTVNPSFEIAPKKIDFFAADFCRSFSVNLFQNLDYSQLQTYEYSSRNLFENDKKCFCPEEECPPRGTLHIGPCTESQIVLSQPHFLNTFDKSLLEYSQGLRPNTEKHGTYVVMEPKTGLALLVKTRFQMNIFLQKFSDIDLMANVSEGLSPIIWLEEGAEVPSHIIDELKHNFEKLKIFDILKYILIISGVVLLAVSLVFAMVKDKVFCFSGSRNIAKNAVSVAEIEQVRKIADIYPHLKIRNVAVIPDSWNGNPEAEIWKYYNRK